MLRRTTCRLAINYVRSYATKSPKRDSKKIPVQLLKDWKGLGVRGEIVRVSPGQMRNQLHPFNGAAYVLDGVPPRILVRTREEVLADQAAEEERLLELRKVRDAEKAAAAANREEAVRPTITVEDLAKLANLTFLGKKGQPTANSANNASSSDYTLRAAIDSLPSRIVLKRPVQTTGFLSQNVTAEEVAAFASNLAGSPIPAAAISFKVRVDRGEIIASKILDHIGNYEASFSVGGTIVKRRVFIEPSNNLNADLPTSRPSIALKGLETVAKEPADSSNNKDSDGQAAEMSKHELSAPGKEPFEWENEFIRRAEQNVRKGN